MSRTYNCSPKTCYCSDFDEIYDILDGMNEKIETINRFNHVLWERVKDLECEKDLEHKKNNQKIMVNWDEYVREEREKIKNAFGKDIDEQIKEENII